MRIAYWEGRPKGDRPARAVGIKTPAPPASTVGVGVIVHPEGFPGRSCARTTEPYYEIWTQTEAEHANARHTKGTNANHGSFWRRL